MSQDPPDDDATISSPPPDATPTPAPAAAAGGGRTDSGNALPLGTYLDEFELRSVAGEGGFSIVYRAWDHSLKRQVAVKEYFPSGMVGRSGGTQVVVRSERHVDAFEAGLRSFVEEARLLAQFDHPALIKVYRFWKANGSAYMVMPFCEGITLRDDWKANAEAPDEAALMALLDPLTDALGVLHAERWYHRDIAPDNVMLLAGTRRPLLLDFGAARQVIGDMTHALTVILKPGYAPIEQWGDVPGMKQGPWTDVYALGALIHFGILRRTPPPSVGRLVNDGYEPLARAAAGRYSERFLAAVDHALAVRPEQRTQSVEQFRDEIGLTAYTQERTLTWMPPAAQRPHPPATAVEPPPAAATPITNTAMPAAAPTLDPVLDVAADSISPQELAPQAAAAPTHEPLDLEIGTLPLPRPAPPPPPPRRRPLLQFMAGLAVTGLLGIGAYAWLKPTPAPLAQLPAPTTPLPATADAAPASSMPPAPTPTAAAPTPEYELAAEFQRLVQLQTPGHAVELTLVRTTLRSDKDALAFTVRSAQDGLLYVYNRGSDGSLLQIYPNRKSGALRVRKNVAIDLPRPQDDELRITGPSGSSDILVMVSRHARDHSELPARDDHGYAFYPTGDTAAALAARQTGPLPWFAGKVKCPGQAPCADEFGAAVATIQIVQ